MFAVYKREFRAYMNNVYGWLFMAVLLLFAGLMMFRENLVVGAPNIEYALLDSEYVLLLMIPILCMRSMAEDKHNKTDMFYLSLPIKTSATVLGKYFALLTVYAIPCAVLAVYPVILGMFGEVHFLSAYSALLFFFLLGAALIAVCQFMSALTDNLVVAAVLGVLSVLILLALSRLESITPALGFMTRISPFLHFREAATYGLFSLSSLVLLLSYPVFFLVLTTIFTDRKRWA